jgi:hypothetical protein
LFLFSPNITTAISILERYHNKPIVTHPIENSTAVVGSSVNLTCLFLSDLNPYIQWTREFANKSVVVVQVQCLVTSLSVSILNKIISTVPNA